MAIKHYKTDNLEVTWEPEKCIHSTLCWKNLGSVFNPAKRPWVDMTGASEEDIANQVSKCPSGALSHKWLDGREEQKPSSKNVAGNAPVMADIESGKTMAWCSCGHSSNQPWCDGSHKGTGHVPTVFKVEESKSYAMCMCKRTGASPFCDGSHAKA